MKVRSLADRYRENERAIIGSCAFMAFLIVWEGLSRGWWAALLSPILGEGAKALAIKPIFISSPTGVAKQAWTMFAVTGEIWPHIAQSGSQLVVGLVAAIVMGVPLGLAAGRYRTFSYILDPFLSAFNATPQVAFLPLLVMWIGTGFWMRVLIIFLLAVIPITMNALAAVRTVDPRLLKVAASFGASEMHTFGAIILPSSLPFILSGMRLAIGRSMIGIVVAELYGSATGIGIMINMAGSSFDTDKVFVGVLVIVIAGLLLVEGVRFLERRLDGWRPAIGDNA
ncbi:MAG: ABC transporter permease [Beijerinckiaceae bacterium]|nr:ABC transporter permease [Beijerinckiaceae bacterium]